MRRVILIIGGVLSWFSISVSLISSTTYPQWALSATLVLLIASAIYFPPATSAGIIVLSGILYDSLLPPASGIFISGFFVTCLMLPFLASSFVRNPQYRFVLLAVLSPLVFASWSLIFVNIMDWVLGVHLQLMFSRMWPSALWSIVAAGMLSILGLSIAWFIRRVKGKFLIVSSTS